MLDKQHVTYSHYSHYTVSRKYKFFLLYKLFFAKKSLSKRFELRAVLILSAINRQINKLKSVAPSHRDRRASGAQAKSPFGFIIWAMPARRGPIRTPSVRGEAFESRLSSPFLIYSTDARRAFIRNHTEKEAKHHVHHRRNAIQPLVYSG